MTTVAEIGSRTILLLSRVRVAAGLSGEGRIGHEGGNR